MQAIRIIKSLISSRSRQRSDDGEAESRVDYIADRLAMEKREVVEVVSLLREEGILADAKDLIAFIHKKESKNRPQNILKQYGMLEQFLLTVIERERRLIHIKELTGAGGAIRLHRATPGARSNTC